MKRKIISTISWCLIIVVCFLPSIFLVSCDSSDESNNRLETIHVFNGDGKGRCYTVEHCYGSYNAGFKVKINGHVSYFSTGTYIYNLDGYCPICGR